RQFGIAGSQATRASGSLARIASKIGSAIWSATLSAGPSVTDSDVNRLIGPPLKLPRRQGRATVWALPRRQVHTSGTSGYYPFDRAAQPGSGALLGIEPFEPTWSYPTP